MGRRLTFDLFDARPDLMERFVEALRNQGGRPLSISAGSDASTPNLTAEIVATEAAPVGYFVISAPAPDYQWCVMLVEEGSKALVDGAVHGHRSAAFAAMVDDAKGTAADAVPRLMLERGMPSVGDPMVLHGDPDRGGISVLLDLFRRTHDEDLRPEHAEKTFDLLRVGDTIVFAVGFESGSLDPFAVVVLHCGSDGSRERFRAAYDEGEAHGPQPPSRRLEARQRFIEGAVQVLAERSGQKGRA